MAKHCFGVLDLVLCNKLNKVKLELLSIQQLCKLLLWSNYCQNFSKLAASSHIGLQNMQAKFVQEIAYHKTGYLHTWIHSKLEELLRHRSLHICLPCQIFSSNTFWYNSHIDSYGSNMSTSSWRLPRPHGQSEAILGPIRSTYWFSHC